MDISTVGPWVLGSNAAPFIIALMATAGGAGVFITAMLLTSRAELEVQLRSVRRRVRSQSGQPESLSTRPDAESPWIPEPLGYWALLQPLPAIARLTGLLAGQFAKRVDERLRYEPSYLQMCSESRNLAGHAVAVAGVLGVTVTFVVALTSGWAAAVAGPVLLVLGSFLAARSPWVLADRWLSARSKMASAELPVLIDAVSLCTRAGMPFDQALDLYSRRFEGRMSQLLAEARDVWKSGISSRMRELDRLSIRLASPVVESFFSAVIQSMDLGTPLAAALDAQAAEVRAQRHAALEERISKLPVKMLIPIGLFTLPAMLILLLAPIAFQVVAGMA